MTKINILIVDDESAARYGLTKALTNPNYNLFEAENGVQAKNVMESGSIDLVISDINMPEMDGLALLDFIKNKSDQQPLTIMLTAYGSEGIAVKAMKAGAYDYLTKPYDIEELRIIVKNAVEKISLRRENASLKKILGNQSSLILGESDAIKAINNLITKVSSTDVTILVTGESGTGKELVARTIHEQSNRANGPYVTMNCAAIPKELIESELFGHEKGAFTGATSQREGKFETAHNGTLFLDEIADMSLDTQAKILRILEEKSFTRLGGKTIIDTDVRFIAATNKSLQKEIEAGNFREDLYYRLNVVPIVLPPLRERGNDVLLLAKHFLDKFSEKHNKNIDGFSTKVRQAFTNFAWPGNVRQLLHTVERAVILNEGNEIGVDNIPDDILSTGENLSIPKSFDKSFMDAKQEYVQAFETEMIKRALDEHHGNVTKTAEKLGLKRQFLQHKLKVLDIDPAVYRIKNRND